MFLAFRYTALVLDLAILGLLRERPRHGYELRRALLDLGFRTVSFGSLYPALRRLERDGLVVADRPGRRRTYRITREGLDRFVTLVAGADPDESDRAFATRLAFLGAVGPRRRLDLLEARRAALVERVHAARASLRAANGPDRYRRALLERRVRAAEADVAWLDELIAAERSGVGA